MGDEKLFDGFSGDVQMETSSWTLFFLLVFPALINQLLFCVWPLVFLNQSDALFLLICGVFFWGLLDLRATQILLSPWSRLLYFPQCKLLSGLFFYLPYVCGWYVLTVEPNSCPVASDQRLFPAVAAGSALSPSDCEELLLDCPFVSRQRSDWVCFLTHKLIPPKTDSKREGKLHHGWRKEEVC